MKRQFKKLDFLILPFILVGLWQLVVSLQLVDSLFLPGPFEVVKKLIAGLTGGEILKHLAYTMTRALLGFFLSSLLGVPLGLIIGNSPRINRLAQPSIDFFRSIPATALFPLFLFRQKCFTTPINFLME